MMDRCHCVRCEHQVLNPITCTYGLASGCAKFRDPLLGALPQSTARAFALTLSVCGLKSGKIMGAYSRSAIIFSRKDMIIEPSLSLIAAATLLR